LGTVNRKKKEKEKKKNQLLEVIIFLISSSRSFCSGTIRAFKKAALECDEAKFAIQAGCW
jgi:hypothetical protein